MVLKSGLCWNWLRIRILSVPDVGPKMYGFFNLTAYLLFVTLYSL